MTKPCWLLSITRDSGRVQKAQGFVAVIISFCQRNVLSCKYIRWDALSIAYPQHIVQTSVVALQPLREALKGNESSNPGSLA